MQQFTRPNGLDRPQLRSQRSSSISNDRASLTVASLPFPPAVRPDPVYIVPTSASQIVTGDHEATLGEEETGGTDWQGPANTVVAPNALALVNSFLDQLLYSFLASSRSTSIASLRPSVTEVLKPRLAQDAIASADAELQEFLGDEEDNDLSVYQRGLEPRGEWDLNNIWRKTRLRCMVYTRLGDLEETDEEIWIERESLDHSEDGHNRLSRDLGVVSPAAAIFLTSILEFIGEQVLLIAGKAAYSRFETRRRQEKHSSASVIIVQRPSVEVVDIEKLAVNTTFGRLWRSWKKKVRSPSITSQRPSSREMLLRPTSSMSTGGSRSPKANLGEAGDQTSTPGTFRRPSTAEDRERASEAAAVPLPATTDDTSEVGEPRVHVWGPSRNFQERPHSMMVPSDADMTTQPRDEARAMGDLDTRRRQLQRNRSSSLPQLRSRELLSPQESFFITPGEDALLNKEQSSTNSYFRNDANPSAVSTMYDGVILQDQDVIDGIKGKELDQPELSASEKARMAMQEMDESLDEMARATNKHRSSDEEAPADFSPYSRRAFSKDRTDDQMRPSFAEQNHTQGSSPPNGMANVRKVNQELPSRVETRLDSKRMQGRATENVSLENRETPIVESTSRQTSEYAENTKRYHIADSEASQSGDGEEEDVPAELRSQFAHANYEDPNISRYGSSPRFYPESTINTSYGVPNQSPTFGQSKLPAKVSDIRKQLPPVSTGVERAAVQRVSPSPGGALDSPTNRTSTSSSRDIRPLRTSGSINSQRASKSKSLMGRESSDTNRPFVVSRTSSEGSTSVVRTPKIDETQRSFEQLIKSDETIQYTLTPQSVRGTDSPESPRHSHSRTGTAELADFIRTSGPPPAETILPPTSRSIVSLKGLDGLRSNPAANAKAAPMPTSAPMLEKQKMQPHRSGPTISKSAHGTPRDAQSGTETTRDFADFIRSTGPEVGPGLSQRDGAVSPPSSKSRPGNPIGPGQRSTSTTSIGRKITKPNPSLSKSPPPVAPNLSARRPSAKLQAREATYEPTHNEDLLDFLKQGPLDDRGIEKRQIAGSVASVEPQNPHLTSNLRSRISDNTRSSFASTQDGSMANQSFQSTNSRTGLLDSPKGQHGGSPASQRPSRFDEPAQPARKQRRVKDPYALDTDSEDENEDNRLATPKPPRQAEYLIDFLNSSLPPENNPRIPSAFDGMPEPNIQKSGNMTRAAATPGLRSANLASSTPQKQQREQQQRTRPTAPPPHSNQPPQLPPLNSRDTSPHLVSTFPITTNPNTQFRPVTQQPPAMTNGLTTPTIPTDRNNPNKMRAKAPGVARTEREAQRGMGDLADFLRNSEPPTTVPEEFRTSGGANRGREEVLEEK
ncbi:MAG: hypothetical protein Q9170_004477, partial [Blastenia crenularia]